MGVILSVRTESPLDNKIKTLAFVNLSTFVYQTAIFSLFNRSNYYGENGTRKK